MLWLQLRNELWKLFGKKRTYIGFLMFLLTQCTVVLIAKFQGLKNMRSTLVGNGYAPEEFITSLTVATLMLIPIAMMMLPLYVSLVGGDMVAKEAEDGTLRMILSRPISRLRLLMVKWLAGVIFSISCAICLGAFGVLFAQILFPWGGMFAFMPGLFSVFSPSDGLIHYTWAVLMMALNATTIMTLAFMFSCFNVKPAAATILGLSFIFLNIILMNIPFFEDIQHWFLTYHLNLWQLMLAQPIPVARIWESVSILTGFNLTFLVVGCTVFQLRDIKS
ncbi:MAG TPA: ABC transporter permease subunit [Verrucomicrobiae bacterium]